MPTGSTGAIRQGRAFVELFTDDTKLQQGLRKAEIAVRRFGAQVSRIGASMMGAGAAILAPLGLAVREYAKAGSALKEMSERTGISVEALSELKYVASQTGASMEDLEKGIRLSQRLLGSSLGGKALAGLGIDIAKLKALSPEEQFIALAESISRIPNQADRASAAMKIFGRGGAALLPFLNQGREGIARLREEARRLGLTMTTADAEAAHQFDNSLARVRQQVLRLVGSIGASLVPALNQFGQWLSRSIPQMRQFVDEHRGWIVLAARAALYAVGLGAALFAVGKIVLGVSMAFAAMRTAVVVVSGLLAVLTSGAAIVGFLRGAVIGIAAAFTAAKTAVMGFGTVSGMVQAVVAIWPAIFLGGLAALLWFTGGFKEMGRVFKQVMGGVGDAIAGGDIELAMRIMWAGVKVIWTEALNWIESALWGLGPRLLKVMKSIGAALLTSFMVLKEGIHTISAQIADKGNTLDRRYDHWEARNQRRLGIITPEEETLRHAEIDKGSDQESIDLQKTKAEHEKQDRADVNDAASAMSAQLDILSKGNAALASERQKELDKRKADLAGWISLAKSDVKRRGIQDAYAAYYGTDPYKPPHGPDLAEDKANAVVGGFDIGAIMSFQAGASDGGNLERIAVATEGAAASLEEIAANGNEGSWGG